MMRNMTWMIVSVAVLAVTSNAPAAITDPDDLTGLAAWWDASNAWSITEAGGAVSQWNDLSGNGHHLTHATGGEQPTTNSMTQNGLNVLDFDGNDRLSRTTSVPLAADDDNYTYFAVWNSNPGGFHQAIYEQGQLNNGQRSSILTQGTTVYGFTGHFNDRRVVPFTVDTYRVTGLRLASIDDVATNNLIQTDNGLEFTSTINTEVGANNLNISTARVIVGANAGGGGEFLNGQIAEVIVYDRTLTDSEHDMVVDYLNTKWDVFIVPPQGLDALAHRWSFNNDGQAEDSIGSADGTLFNGATVSGGKLTLDGVDDYVRTSAIDNTIGEKTLVAWVTLDNLAQRSGSVLTLENPSGGDVFDGIVYGERTANQWMNGSNGHSRSNGVDNGGALEASLQEIMMAITYEADGTITIYRDGVEYAQYASGFVSYPGGMADVLLGLRHEDISGGSGSAAGNDQWWAGMINEARIYADALTADQMAQLFAAGPDSLGAVIPTPAALPAGLLAMGLLVARRRR